MATILQTTFSNIFLNSFSVWFFCLWFFLKWEYSYLMKIWLRFVPIGTNLSQIFIRYEYSHEAMQLSSTGIIITVDDNCIASCNGLALKKQQANIWTNVCFVNACIYASLGLDELIAHLRVEFIWKYKHTFIYISHASIYWNIYDPSYQSFCGII